MSALRVLALVLVFVSAIGCGASAAGATRTLAAQDFRCPPADVAVEAQGAAPDGDARVRATGCGQTALYSNHCSAYECRAYRESESIEATENAPLPRRVAADGAPR